MNALNALREKLSQRADVSRSERANEIRIEPSLPSGFAITLSSSVEGWCVSLGDGGFHETFNAAEEALNFVAWTRSSECRLREIWRGRSLEKAVVETFEGGEWRPVLTNGVLLFPFWRRRREFTLQNSSERERMRPPS